MSNPAVPSVPFGKVRVSRLILGSNPFSGFSHQSAENDTAMRHYYTAERIKAEFRKAEAIGAKTFLGRADHHIMRVLMEYWDEGGTIQWFAQTCPEVGTSARCARSAIGGGAAACYVHGGRMDWLLANDQLDEAADTVATIRKAGLAAGVAGHNPKVFDWAEANLDVDFYMCSYYNPTDRSQGAEHRAGDVERWRADDRDAMVRRIATLSKPVIHYKIFAAGRTDPAEAFAFVAEHLRPQDVVCVGIYSKDKPDMFAENAALLAGALRAAGKTL